MTKRRRKRQVGQPRTSGRSENRCAWCRAAIPADHEVFGISAKAHPAFKDDLKKNAGHVVPLVLERAKRAVDMSVVGEDSQAKREGWDLAFMVCSETCGAALRDALRQEKATIELN